MDACPGLHACQPGEADEPLLIDVAPADLTSKLVAGEADAPLNDDLTAANALALRARVRELEVENGLIQRELAHVGELAERQGQQLQCAVNTLGLWFM